MTAHESLDERRKRRELAKRLHPDAGGDADAFKEAFSELDMRRPAPLASNVFALPSPTKRLWKRFIKRTKKGRRRSFIDLN